MRVLNTLLGVVPAGRVFSRATRVAKSRVDIMYMRSNAGVPHGIKDISGRNENRGERIHTHGVSNTADPR